MLLLSSDYTYKATRNSNFEEISFKYGSVNSYLFSLNYSSVEHGQIGKHAYDFKTCVVVSCQKENF